MNNPIQNDAHLAKLLGVSKSAVCRAKQRGMPTDDLAAACAWRDVHLSPSMRKDRNPARAASGRRADQAGGDAQLVRVHALFELASSAIGTPSFEALRPALQQAMRAVPAELRPRVRLEFRVMDQLLQPVLKLLSDAPEAPAAAGAGDVMASADADLMGTFWYAMAAGEPFPAALLQA